METSLQASEVDHILKRLLCRSQRILCSRSRALLAWKVADGGFAHSSNVTRDPRCCLLGADLDEPDTYTDILCVNMSRNVTKRPYQTGHPELGNLTYGRHGRSGDLNFYLLRFAACATVRVGGGSVASKHQASQGVASPATRDSVAKLCVQCSAKPKQDVESRSRKTSDIFRLRLLMSPSSREAARELSPELQEVMVSYRVLVK